VANFIAAQIKTNVRELEGLLTKLKAQSSLTGLEISLEMAKQILKVESTTEGSEVSVEAIQNAVCRYFNIKISDLKSTKRSREIALPRQIAMYLIRKYTNYGLKEIGRFFGGKDHSTIIHACNQISKQIDSDPEVAKAVEGVQNLL
jgi:chromosomal replication initiator protein